MRFPYTIFAALFLMCSASIAQLTVSSTDAPGAVRIVLDQTIADVHVDPNDAKVVQIAANLLVEDVERVTTRTPRVVNDPAQLGAHAIIIGTIGQSRLIDQLIADGKIDVSEVKGKWESYRMQVVASPLPNVRAALVIAGSDRRGSAYGAFTVSESIGVSPWYWWADVTPRKRDALVIAPTTITQGPPSVKFRGIFINDEDWGMQPWAARTIEPEVNDMGPKTYGRIFELLLRLKANFCWPAMHPSTQAFNIYPQNKVVADDYAIVMGSSHCEPMLRNNVTEWGERNASRYNFVTNRDGVLNYWRERVQENGKFENVYTLGMRGIHDSDMAGGGTRAERVERLNTIMAEQRKMITELVNPDPSKVPQIMCPYKEVLLLYQAGAVPADDVTLVWADDNHGYIRQLATPEEQTRGGGFGVYYHISYWGRPHDYLWLASVPPTLIWQELSKAYDYNSRTLWVINVGDLKPAEIGMDFSLQYAYDTSRYNPVTIQNYLADFATRHFGADRSREIAQVLTEFYELNFQRKPEHMGFNRSQDPRTNPVRTQFSPIHYGDEVNQRLARFRSMRERADAIYAELPADRKDAFYQLVVYPVRGSALMNEMVLNTDLNHRYAAQGRASANDFAQKAQAAHAEIQKETAYYNNELAGGKWRHMMTSNPRNLPVFSPQATVTVNPPDAGSLGVAIEGRAEALNAGEAAALPLFSAELRQRRFIDLFNRGKAPVQWSAQTSDPWIRLSSTSGTLEKDERLMVDLDALRLPQSVESGKITIKQGDTTYTIDVRIRNSRAPASIRFVEADGYLSIPAEDMTRKSDRNGAGWTTVRRLGRMGDAVAVYPTNAPSVPDVANLMGQAPRVEYDFQVYSGSESATVTVQALPTHRIHPGRELRYAVAIDDQPPQVVDLESAEFSAEWSVNVLRASAFGVTKHPIAPGRHTLRIFMVDPGVVLDHLTIDLGGLKPSYLPPPQTARAMN